MINKFIASILLLILYIIPTFAQDGLFPISPDIKKGILKNGLVYYIKKNKVPNHRVELRLVLNVGSILEDDNEQGLAHFVEHMCFENTKHFNKQNLIDFLEKNGVIYGADINAITNFDATIFNLRLATDNPLLMNKGFQILEDWSHNVLFENKEIDKERGIIGEEIRLGEGANSRLINKYFPIILNGSKYSRRLPMGTKQNIDTLKVSQLKAFYKKWYRPDLQALIVVGDIDVNSIENLIKLHFNKICNPINEKPRKYYTIPTHDSTYVFIATDSEQQYTIFQLLYLQPHFNIITQNDYRQSMVITLFNHMVNYRLKNILQKNNLPILQASIDYQKLIGDKDAISLLGVSKEGEIKESIEFLLREHARILHYGFTNFELDKAKKHILSTYESLWLEKKTTNSSLLVRELINNYLFKEPIPGLEYEYKLNKKIISTITKEEIQKAAQKWMNCKDKIVLISAPKSQTNKLLNTKEILTLINDTIKEKKIIYDDADSIFSPLLASTEPKAGKILKENTNSLGITEWILSNGSKVFLKPTKFSENKIQFSGISQGGTSLYSDTDYLSAGSASKLIALSDIKNDYLQTLKAKIDEGQINVTPYINRYNQGFVANSSTRSIEDALKLMYYYFTNASINKKVFNSTLEKLSTILSTKENNPTVLFEDTLKYIIENYNLRYRPLDIKRIKEFNINKSQKIYNECFANVSNFNFVFTGDFNISKLRPLIEKFIASLPSLPKRSRVQFISSSSDIKHTDKIIYLGNENKASARLYFNSPTTFTQIDNIQINQICTLLKINFTKVLREEQGKIYNIDVDGQINQEPLNNYRILISFSSATENINSITDIILEKICEYQKNGFSKIDISKVITQGIKDIEVKYKDNDYWRNLIEDSKYYNNPLLGFKSYKYIIKKLTPEKSKQLMQKYFQKEVFSKIIQVPTLMK